MLEIVMSRRLTSRSCKTDDPKAEPKSLPSKNTKARIFFKHWLSFLWAMQDLPSSAPPLGCWYKFCGYFENEQQRIARFTFMSYSHFSTTTLVVKQSLDNFGTFHNSSGKSASTKSYTRKNRTSRPVAMVSVYKRRD